MKKIFAMMLALCLLLSLVACGGEQSAESQQTDGTQGTTQDTTQGTTQSTTQATEATESTAPVDEHTHAYTEEVTAPTCTEDGYTTYTCECGDSYQDNAVTATGHAFADATCTAPKTCSVCGETEGEACGHSFGNATCTAPKTCSVCGETQGTANGHNFSDATCTQGQLCSACGAAGTGALGHDFQAGTCSRCGEVDPDFVSHGLTDGRWYIYAEERLYESKQLLILNFTEDGKWYLECYRNASVYQGQEYDDYYQEVITLGDTSYVVSWMSSMQPEGGTYEVIDGNIHLYIESDEIIFEQVDSDHYVIIQEHPYGEECGYPLENGFILTWAP